jgi:hypothetical protein
MHSINNNQIIPISITLPGYNAQSAENVSKAKTNGESVKSLQHKAC